MPPRRRQIATLAVVAVVGLVLVPEAGAQSVLDRIVDDYRTAAEAARPTLLGIARGTFGVLAVIEIALAGLWWTLRERGPAEVLSALVVKLGWLGFVFALLSSFNAWFPAIIDGFVQAGQASTAVPVPSPGDILDQGRTLSLTLREGFDADTGLTDLVNPTVIANALMLFVVALLLELVFIVIAAVVVLTFVEAFVALSVGSLVLGFAAFRGTASLADRFVAYVFAVGIRLFLIYFLVGIAQNLGPVWEAQVAAAPGDIDTGLLVLGGGVVLAFVITVLPFKMGSTLTAGFEPGFARGILAVG